VSHAFWFVNRGSGVVLVAVLTLATALGVLATSGGGSRRWPRFALQSLHRNISLLACALLLAHAVTPVLDGYVNHYAPITWLDVAVPFLSAYKPLALGLGTLALDLIAIAVVTSVARHRFSRRTWFGLHLLTYVSWGLGVVHGFLIGTDARTSWGLGVTVASVLVVAAAVVVRLVVRPAGPQTGPSTGQVPVLAPEAVLPPPSQQPEHGRRRAGRRAAV
jgi:methionine sulfoxide reductase heme-binding subunit